MRIRHSGGGLTDKIELQMTPMIDVVFQLLIFFMFTFKIAAQEGDFNVKMPLLGGAAAMQGTLPPYKVRLVADAEGNLVGIRLGDVPLSGIPELHERIIADLGPGVPLETRESAEVELDCDYGLDYRHVIAAVTACSGYVTPEGNVVKLIEKVRLAPPRP